MIELRGIRRVLVYPGFTNMRYGINRLMALVGKAEDGCLYVFCGRTRRNAKVLHVEANGCWLYQRKIAYTRFQFPRSGDPSEITPEALRWLLDGVTLIDTLEGRGEHPEYD